MRTLLSYPVNLWVEDDGTTIVFPDIPEAITGHADKAAALNLASDCLEEALAGRMLDREDIPVPSPARGRPLVAPGAVMAGKTALYKEMRARGLSNAALARMLGVRETEVRRMLDPKHATKIGRLEQALATLGQRIVVSVEPA